MGLAGFALAGSGVAVVSGLIAPWLVAGVLVAGAGITFGAIAASRRPVTGVTGDVHVIDGVRLWESGSRKACEDWLAEVAGEPLKAHASRTSALTRLMAEQLAVPPEQVDELMLAGFLHVLPARYESGHSCGEWPNTSLDEATTAIAFSGHESAARTVAECQERWDGAGTPLGLTGEASTLAGRILATACAFDSASSRGLELGLAAIREGSGSKFDPVVAAELLYLFTEPWQLRQVA